MLPQPRQPRQASQASITSHATSTATATANHTRDDRFPAGASHGIIDHTGSGTTKARSRENPSSNR